MRSDKTAIVWFTTDLRLQDNETLIKACEAYKMVLPVFIFQPYWFQVTTFGTQKLGAKRLAFLKECLFDLKKNLKLIGGDLLIQFGRPEYVLYELAKKYNVEKVFVKKEVPFEELQIQKTVTDQLMKINVELEVFSTSTLFHPDDLPFSIKDIPEVFTNFRKKVEKESTIRSCYSAPDTITLPPSLPADQWPPDTIMSLIDQLQIHAHTSFPFKGGETEAKNRLNFYFHESKLVSGYKDTRNGMAGVNYSSKFSPWLALGCMSPRLIYHELKQFEQQHGSNDSTYWLFFELMWRDYFRFLMKKNSYGYFLKHGIKPELKHAEEHQAHVFEKWKNGNTGTPIIDAAMNELNKTGFMSNRARQLVASYLVNDLRSDWRYGAAYFEEMLIDYDVCSNWGNWAYLAGVGNDPRGKRYFDINKQTEAYDKNAIYRNLWLN
ncbi:MAG: DASH family cryptochrome [Sphingobacteriaceae bacterium]